ncbi:MAG: sulfur oxidation c-type cytochrome SoxX [Alphaproteobacteria bacterium]|nr:sulfur oxidation c-type cytochrome SoxX [Alphaproteobacteria bacterium]
MRHVICAAAALAVLSGLAAPAWAQGKAPLVTFEYRDGAIAASLTGKAGDPQRGRQVIVGRTLGNCLACHEIAALKNEPYHGNTAPSLDGVASRMSEGEMRLRVVDGTKVNPDTMMPPFYRVDGLNKVMKRFQDTTILSAEQVEDVVAYLKTLR